MKNYLLIHILAWSISSCETDRGNYDGYKIAYESKMEYYIVLDKTDTVLENYPFYKKGTFIKYYRNDSVIDTVFISDKGMIVAPFIDINKTLFDNTFILIVQKPLDSICECNDTCLINTYQNSRNLPKYKMCYEALENSSFYQYWIINKLSNTVYGPYRKDEFLNKRRELGVPKELKFDFE